MTDTLLPIGRFARLTGLSIGALRHYDELGLLAPAEIDPVTGYRRYRESQLDRARTIRRLREIDVSLDEVERVLGVDDPAERARVLRSVRGRIEARAWHLHYAIHVLNQLIGEKEDLVATEAPDLVLTPQQHRRLGVDLFNFVWTLIEKVDRTPEEIDTMIHAAHASRHHWSLAAPAGPENLLAASGSAPACMRSWTMPNLRCGTRAAASRSARRTGSATGTSRSRTRRWPVLRASRATGRPSSAGSSAHARPANRSETRRTASCCSPIWPRSEARRPLRFRACHRDLGRRSRRGGVTSFGDRGVQPVGSLTGSRFKLKVSLRYSPEPGETDFLCEFFRIVSGILWDATDGRLAIGQVDIATGSTGGADADIWIHPADTAWPNSTGARLWIPGESIDFAQDYLMFPTVLVHELGHYLFGLRDEYASGAKCVGKVSKQASLMERYGWGSYTRWTDSFGDVFQGWSTFFPAFAGKSAKFRGGQPSEFCFTGNHDANANHPQNLANGHQPCWTYIANDANHNAIPYGLSLPAAIGPLKKKPPLPPPPVCVEVQVVERSLLILGPREPSVGTGDEISDGASFWIDTARAREQLGVTSGAASRRWRPSSPLSLPTLRHRRHGGAPSARRCPSAPTNRSSPTPTHCAPGCSTSPVRGASPIGRPSSSPRGCPSRTSMRSCGPSRTCRRAERASGRRAGQ